MSLSDRDWQDNMADSTIIPAMSPPAGQTSNFIDPPYIGTKFLVVNCVFLPIAAIALLIRTWTRLFIVRSFRWDDCESLVHIDDAILLTGRPDFMIIALVRWYNLRFTMPRTQSTNTDSFAFSRSYPPP